MNPYLFDNVDHRAAWFKLRYMMKAHADMNYLDKETVWYVLAFMDLIENVQPLPRHIYEADDITPRYVLQGDAQIDDDALALALYKAAKQHQTVDSGAKVGPGEKTVL